MRRAVIAAAALAYVAWSSSAFAAYQEVAVKDGGTLTGVVRFTGAPPRGAPIAVAKNRDVCGDQTPSETLVVGSDRGVKGGAILVEGVTRGKKGGSDVVVETQKCHFVSHVMTTGPGDHVRVKNSDAVLHNTHGFLGKATVFNVALPHKDQMVDITRRLTTPGVVRVLCDAHPHMRAWIVVHDSPYFAVTDDRGAFKIDGVPPGTYKVTLWHEAFRTVTKTVLIAANGSANLDFELK